MGVRVFSITVLFMSLLWGCRPPEGSERWPGSLDVRTESSDQLQPEQMRLIQAAPPASDEELNLVREIGARKDQMFATDPPQRVLDEAEMIFLRAGELPTLLGYYIEGAEQRGEPSPLDARIAWLYQRLGVENLALAQARYAVQTSPQDPFAHFALAYVLGQQASRYEDPYPEMIQELETVLQLAPDFQVVGVVERNQLESEYRRLRREHASALEPTNDASAPAP